MGFRVPAARAGGFFFFWVSKCFDADWAGEGGSRAGAAVALGDWVCGWGLRRSLARRAPTFSGTALNTSYGLANTQGRTLRVLQEVLAKLPLT